MVWGENIEYSEKAENNGASHVGSGDDGFGDVPVFEFLNGIVHGSKLRVNKSR